MSDLKNNTPDSRAKEAINRTLDNKILLGVDTGNLKLHNTCIRQEVIVLIYRLYNLVK